VIASTDDQLIVQRLGVEGMIEVESLAGLYPIKEGTRSRPVNLIPPAMWQRRLLSDGMPLKIKSGHLPWNDSQPSVLAFFVTHVKKKMQTLRHTEDRPALINRPHERRYKSAISNESHSGSKRSGRRQHNLGASVQAIDRVHELSVGANGREGGLHRFCLSRLIFEDPDHPTCSAPGMTRRINNS